MALSSKGPDLPLASLRLLVPPLRLMTAFAWKVAREHEVKQYDKLLDFITLITETIPEILDPSQKAQLVIGLRAKLVLELCRGDAVTDLKLIQSHLDKIHTSSSELSKSNQMGHDLPGNCYSNFAALVQNILDVPFEREFFFHEVFHEKFGSAFNLKIQELVSVFLSRLEELLPIPNYQQMAAWLTEEEFSLTVSDPDALETLLLHHGERGILTSTPSSDEDDIILSTLACSIQTGVKRSTERCVEEDDGEYDSDVRPLGLEDSERDQGFDDASDNWSQSKKSGLKSVLYMCAKCSFIHSAIEEVDEHMQREHQPTGHKPIQIFSKEVPRSSKDKHGSLRRARRKEGSGSGKQRGRKKKRDQDKKRESENGKRRIRKEPTGPDKRFLSMRAVRKTFSEEELKCQMCEKLFEHPNQLKTHVRLHSLRYHCGQCEKGFTSHSGYYQHQQLHKRGRIFICDVCDKGFLSNSALKQHRLLHEGPSNLCNVCGKNLSRNGFVRHMRMHKGEKNYLCTVCGKAFFSSGELQLHNRSHTGETPYTCTQCGKGFSCRSHLNVHTRSHTGERPYACSECPKRFLTLHCLRRHSLSHNGVKPFKCPKCEKEFSQQGNLKRHLTTHKLDT